MGDKSERRTLEIVVRDGKPTAVIIDIDEYREMLERLEDLEDLKMLKEMREKPLKFRKLEDFLKDIAQVYEVYLERAAERDLKHLPDEVFDRIVSRIQALAKDPRPPGCRKIVGSGSDWRIRIGSYRVIYEIDDVEKAVRVMRVVHRRDAYK
ncbi:MAG TPA: hypothetical protein ENF73_04435 [Proteobacteria bacterium]|nr:hypothetical protein [Pseudomonadota bacterium]